MACGRRFACFTVAIICLFFLNNSQVKGQLNLYITREHLNNDLRMNFKTDIYIIKAGVPAELLRSPEALYSLVSPISPVVTKIQFSWYSGPQAQKEHYSIQFSSSDTKIMASPTLSIKTAGFVPHSTSIFEVNFACSGIKSGIVNLGFSLNYTRVTSGVLQTTSMKQLKFNVRRYCNESAEIPSTSKTPKKVHHMSRALIVGLCAAVTILLCVSVGAALLCRYNIMKKRKLHIEFEDDVDLKAPPKKDGRLKKEGSLKPPDSPPIYSPPSKQSSYLGGRGHYPSVVYSPPKRLFSKPGSRHRPRHQGTSGSDSSTTVLIDIDEENELEITPKNCYGRDKRDVSESLLSVRSTCEVTAQSTSSSREGQSSRHCNVEHSCMTLEQNKGSHGSKDVFAAPNEFWATQLAGILLRKEQLELGRVLWSGEFGLMWHGTVWGMNRDQPQSRVEVVVKALKDMADSLAVTSFSHEAMTMKDFAHPNVLSLLGVVLPKSTPLQLVLQYTKNGDLHKYLLSKWPAASSSPTIPARQLINFTVQIAKGMEYLASKEFVHRNLAAKNCMVSEDLTVKIANFAPVQDSNSLEYYHMGKKTSLSAKWLAIEALTNRMFSEKSDVWSFGVVLWEMLTFGKEPYPNVEDEQVLEHLQNDYRLLQPSYCTKPIYSIMRSCWTADPAKRPTFTRLVNQLGGYERILAPGSVYFRLVEQTDY